MRSYYEAIKYLNSFMNFEASGFEGFKESLELSRLVNVLENMERPDRAYRSVHVAGTKGKGSVCTYVASILEASGYKVGLFTSPHLYSISERIKINGSSISNEAFAGVMSNLKPYIKNGEGKFTYFEILTLAAILFFQQEKVDYAVFETGLGGRLDATNIIEAEVVGITPISFDHTDILGETIEKITSEKAEIIKKNVKCVISRQNKNSEKIIESKCLSAGVDLFKADRDFSYDIFEKDTKGSTFTVLTNTYKYNDCHTAMLGEFQVENVAQAICLCEQLLKEKIDIEQVKMGIENAFIPGRLEVISKEPLIVIDGAHNEESSKKLKYSIEEIFKYDRLILILGLSRGKDIEGICQNLKSLADSTILTKAISARAMDPHILRGYFKGQKATVTSDIKEALGRAFLQARKNDLILVTGSFFMIGEVRQEIFCE